MDDTDYVVDFRPHQRNAVVEHYRDKDVPVITVQPGDNAASTVENFIGAAERLARDYQPSGVFVKERSRYNPTELGEDEAIARLGEELARCTAREFGYNTPPDDF